MNRRRSRARLLAIAPNVQRLSQSHARCWRTAHGPVARGCAPRLASLSRWSRLMAQGKHIVPTETGLSLFGVLKQADPALVDPGVTAQLECLLDDVVIGEQEMVSAIDAVCDVAERIISKLKEGSTAGKA